MKLSSRRHDCANAEEGAAYYCATMENNDQHDLLAKTKDRRYTTISGENTSMVTLALACSKAGFATVPSRGACKGLAFEKDRQ